LALLLNIDTATEVASVCVSLNGISLAFKENRHQKEHASFLHAAIKIILNEAGINISDIDAFSVTSGPGSYTGLRVGMASAKGFSYAFSKPLITINTLEVMAKTGLDNVIGLDPSTLLCPMLDARRMEVFTALYDIELKNVFPPQPLILQENSFNSLIAKGKIVFFGSGSDKFKAVVRSHNAVFEVVDYSAQSLASLADKAFQQKKFTDVSYSEPTYFKDFHSMPKR
jgi:tRNA threonylcarbamoyladenosine biosynthesis protein TsaB